MGEWGGYGLGVGLQGGYGGVEGPARPAGLWPNGPRGFVSSLLFCFYFLVIILFYFFVSS